MIVFHLIAILALHFVADFLLQSRKMGRNKGKSIMWLSMHVGVYLIALLSVGLLFGHYVTDNMVLVFEYCLLNGILHWVTDYCTSKASGFCYLKMTQKVDCDNTLAPHVKRELNEKRKSRWEKAFWSVIGFDQFLHAFALLITYHYFFV
jgi:hypothetical protein